MRFVMLMLTVLASLQPLPGLPSVPDGTQVQVYRSDLKMVMATGEVKARTLVLLAPKAKMPVLEKVNVLILAKPGGQTEPLSVLGQVTKEGTDILLQDKVTLSQLLREVYGVKLELRESK